VTITPTNPLPESKYTIAIHTGAVKDLAGNPVAATSSSFSVGTSPTMTNIDPANNATNVATDKIITATFNENIQNGTGWIELKNNSGTVIPTTITINNNILTITPTNPLTNGTKYTIYIHTGAIKDLAGNPTTAYTTRFTTTT
jgi:hypothetical protein